MKSEIKFVLAFLVVFVECVTARSVIEISTSDNYNSDVSSENQDARELCKQYMPQASSGFVCLEEDSTWNSLHFWSKHVDGRPSLQLWYWNPWKSNSWRTVHDAREEHQRLWICLSWTQCNSVFALFPFTGCVSDDELCPWDKVYRYTWYSDYCNAMQLKTKKKTKWMNFSHLSSSVLITISSSQNLITSFLFILTISECVLFVAIHDRSWRKNWAPSLQMIFVYSFSGKDKKMRKCTVFNTEVYDVL